MFEDVVSYSCDLGYALDGTNSRSCLSTGAWSGDDPTCVFAGKQYSIKCDFKFLAYDGVDFRRPVLNSIY